MQMIRLVAGQTNLRLTESVASENSKLLAVMSSGRTKSATRSQGNEGEIKVSLKDKYSQVLADYGRYLENRQEQLYLQLELADFLEDSGYFQSTIQQLYRHWSKLWPQIVDQGSVAEINYEIYLLTPWLYLPKELVVDTIFVKDWLDKNYNDEYGEDGKDNKDNKDITPAITLLDSKVIYLSRWVQASKDNLENEEDEEDEEDEENEDEEEYSEEEDCLISLISLQQAANSGVLLKSKTTFHPESYNIAEEEIYLNRPLNVVFELAPAAQAIRSLQYAMEEFIDDTQINRLVKITTEWTETGTLLRTSYYIVNHAVFGTLDNSLSLRDAYSREFTGRVLTTERTGRDKQRLEERKILATRF